MVTVVTIAGLIAFALICFVMAARSFKKHSTRTQTPPDTSSTERGDRGRAVPKAAFAAPVTDTSARQEPKDEGAGRGLINSTGLEDLTVRSRRGQIAHPANSIVDAGKDNSGSDVRSANAEADKRTANLSIADGRSLTRDKAHAAEPIDEPTETRTDSETEQPIIADGVPATPIEPTCTEPPQEQLVRIPVEAASLNVETRTKGEISRTESFHCNAQDNQATYGEENTRVSPEVTVLETPSGTDVEQAVASGRGRTPDANVAGPEANETETVDPIQLETDAGSAPPLAAKPRTPRQFRPAPRAIRQPRTAKSETVTGSAFDRALPICVRLVFEKAGYCRISLLARRSPNHPEELAISGAGDPPPLAALQDEWFQDYVPSNAGPLLRQGVEWSGVLPNGELARWSLSGRELYVLAPHADLSGFVSTTRLVIGDEHVVLCTAERLRQVSEAIADAGSQLPTIVNGGKGLPAGWVALRGVIPRTPVAANAEGDILDVLRPLAEVQIALEGGIRLGRQAWLAGYPPHIRLRGDIQSAGTVRIDGVEATVGTSGSLTVPGWDQAGQHFVSSASASRSYAVQEGAEEWQGWDAYTWSMGDLETDTIDSRPAICGATVRPPPAAPTNHPAFVISASNMVLIGPVPGDIEKCSTRADLSLALSLAFPAFSPVWALPVDPLHSDKRTARAELIGRPYPPGEEQTLDCGPESRSSARERRRREDMWRDFILDACRKGLLTEPQSADTAALWQEYKDRARKLRRLQ